MTPKRQKMPRYMNSVSRNLARSAVIAFTADGFVAVFTASSLAGHSGRFGVVEQAGSAIAAGLAATGGLCLQLSRRTERAYQRKLAEEDRKNAEVLLLAQRAAAQREAAAKTQIVVPPPAQRHRPSLEPQQVPVPVLYMDPDPQPATGGLARVAIGE